MSFNSISVLDDGVFDDMPLLETIIVSDSGIEAVHPIVFCGLQNLREVDLRNNNNRYTIHADVFQHNPNLTILDLSSNDLTELRLDFSHILDLSNNNNNLYRITSEDGYQIAETCNV
jgi:Leucine-rich repeat (LRR) protein